MILEKETAWNQITQSIKEADKVLVGIGLELELSDGGDRKKQIMAYEKLKKILAEKDFFIISLCADDMIYTAFKRNDRVVCPCGGRLWVQCGAACTKELYPVEEVCPDAVPYLERAQWSKAKEQLSRCPHCNEPLNFNNIQADHYIEDGYLEDWGTYKKWLQSTMNRRICILELGVGMQFPGIVRWAFDKLAYYNQKAVFYRVHTSLYQHTSENGERGFSVKENGLEFLEKANVEVGENKNI